MQITPQTPSDNSGSTAVSPMAELRRPIGRRALICARGSRSLPGCSYGCRVAPAADAGTVRRIAPERHRAPFYEPARPDDMAWLVLAC
jgi:hypothetical protein